MSNHPQISDIAYELRGTCKTIQEVLEIMGVDEDNRDWEDELLDENTEMCVQCNWWFECCELEFNESLNGGLCDQCLEDLR